MNFKEEYFIKEITSDNDYLNKDNEIDYEETYENVENFGDNKNENIKEINR